MAKKKKEQVKKVGVAPQSIGLSQPPWELDGFISVLPQNAPPKFAPPKKPKPKKAVKPRIAKPSEASVAPAKKAPILQAEQSNQPLEKKAEAVAQQEVVENVVPQQVLVANEAEVAEPISKKQELVSKKYTARAENFKSERARMRKEQRRKYMEERLKTWDGVKKPKPAKKTADPKQEFLQSLHTLGIEVDSSKLHGQGQDFSSIKPSHWDNEEVARRADAVLERMPEHVKDKIIALNNSIWQAYVQEGYEDIDEITYLEQQVLALEQEVLQQEQQLMQELQEQEMLRRQLDEQRIEKIEQDLEEEEIAQDFYEAEQLANKIIEDAMQEQALEQEIAQEICEAEQLVEDMSEQDLEDLSDEELQSLLEELDAQAELNHELEEQRLHDLQTQEFEMLMQQADVAVEPEQKIIVDESVFEGEEQHEDSFVGLTAQLEDFINAEPTPPIGLTAQLEDFIQSVDSEDNQKKKLIEEQEQHNLLEKVHEEADAEDLYALEGAVNEQEEAEEVEEQEEYEDYEQLEELEEQEEHEDYEQLEELEEQEEHEDYEQLEELEEQEEVEDYEQADEQSDVEIVENFLQEQEQDFVDELLEEQQQLEQSEQMPLDDEYAYVDELYSLDGAQSKSAQKKLKKQLDEAEDIVGAPQEQQEYAVQEEEQLEPYGKKDGKKIASHINSGLENGTVVLQIQNVTKRFKKRVAVNNVSFDVRAGEVFGFLGPNGSGKTTLIRMICGLAEITEGEIFVCGQSVRKNYRDAVKNVGGIIENPELYKYMSGWDNMKYYASLYKGISDHDIMEIVKLVRMEKRIHEKVKRYSLGMRQRVGIAQSLLHNPKILLLDEPTNGLDPAGIREMRDFLKMLAHERGLSILISSHILTEMQLMCDRVAIILNGDLLAIKTIDEWTEHTEKNKLIKLGTNQPRAAAKLIQDTFGVSVEVGNHMMVFSLPTDQLPQVSLTLASAGISITTLEIGEKSLEETFLELTGKGSTIL